MGSTSCQEFNLRKHNTSQAKSLSSLRAEDKLDQLQDGHEIRFKRVKMKKKNELELKMEKNLKFTDTHIFHLNSGGTFQL